MVAMAVVAGGRGRGDRVECGHLSARLCGTSQTAGCRVVVAAVDGAVGFVVVFSGPREA